MSLADGGLWVEVGPHSLCEHVLDAVLVEGRALHVADGLDLTGEGSPLLMGNGRLVLLFELPLRVGVAPEVALCADKEDGNARAVMRHLMVVKLCQLKEMGAEISTSLFSQVKDWPNVQQRIATRGHPLSRYICGPAFVLWCKHHLNSDLWVPLVFDVLVGGGAWDGETDDEDIGLGVGQGPQAIILLLTRRVPQVQAHDPAVYCHLNAPHVETDVAQMCTSTKRHHSFESTLTTVSNHIFVF